MEADTRLWTTIGTVVGLRQGGRSALVRVGTRTYLRNRRFLRSEASDPESDAASFVSDGNGDNDVPTDGPAEPRRSARARCTPDRLQAGNTSKKKKKKPPTRGNP